MPNKIIFHPEAQAELNESLIYYEIQLKGQGYKFENEVQVNINIIKVYPESYAKRHGHYRETK